MCKDHNRHLEMARIGRTMYRQDKEWQVGDNEVVISSNMQKDNCTSQNKNWTIFTALVDEVNRPGPLEEMIIRYFEKGHTFMSADSFHHQIEKGMRAAKNVLDGGDFFAVINTTGMAVAIGYQDFVQFKNGSVKELILTNPYLQMFMR